MKSWLEIDAQRLTGNLAALQGVLREQAAPNAELLAVIKADAYGHGIIPCATILAQAGATWLGVTDAREGTIVRTTLAAAGIAPKAQPNILVMCGMTDADEATAIVRHALTPVIWTLEHLDLLLQAQQAAASTGPLRVHVEVDTGMARQGVAIGNDLTHLLTAIAAEPSLLLDGVFTHFASTEVAHAQQTTDQQHHFEQAISQLQFLNLRPTWVHVGNSSFLDNAADRTALTWLRSQAERVNARPMARAGLALYGYLLPIEAAAIGDTERLRPLVHPVMSWKTRVIGIREIGPGATVGYNGTFTADRPMRLALLPAGYADGLRRGLSAADTRPGGWVILHEQRAPIVGRVSMNLTVVDVTAIPQAAVGDEALLLGDGITADDHARLAGTIAYEILCGVRTIFPSTPRV